MHMAAIPAVSQGSGVRRTSAAPSVRHPSAVTAVAASCAGQEWRTTPAPSTGSAASQAQRGPRTTPIAASTTRTGVATAASTASQVAPWGAARTPKVPAISEPGSTSAQPGDRNRLHPAKPAGRGRTTRRPWIAARPQYAANSSGLSMERLMLPSSSPLVIGSGAALFHAPPGLWVRAATPAVVGGPLVQLPSTAPALSGALGYLRDETKRVAQRPTTDRERDRTIFVSRPHERESDERWAPRRRQTGAW